MDQRRQEILCVSVSRNRWMEAKVDKCTHVQYEHSSAPPLRAVEFSILTLSIYTYLTPSSNSTSADPGSEEFPSILSGSSRSKYWSLLNFFRRLQLTWFIATWNQKILWVNLNLVNISSSQCRCKCDYEHFWLQPSVLFLSHFTMTWSFNAQSLSFLFFISLHYLTHLSSLLLSVFSFLIISLLHALQFFYLAAAASQKERY